MHKKKRLFPFWLIPAHWGLTGKAKELAKINYYYSGKDADLMSAEHMYLTPYEIDKAKMEINKKYDDISELLYRIGVVDLDLKYNRISKLEHSNLVLDIRYELKELDEKEYEAQKIELLPDGVEKKLAAIEYSYKYHEITENEYHKEIATINKEPWGQLYSSYNPEEGSIEFSFDYNEYFWKKLKADGHPGNDEDEIIDNYIRYCCRNIAQDDNEVSESDDVVIPDILPEGFKSYK
ncbi:hypothetical protein [Klebsiella phage phiKp_21]|uniref:Uncharacterized protein n=1 Tax=Klebsiella phage vB_KleM_RaK2 TaxID=1147094 RepID=H6X3R2_9CAUD|nr:virion structural protein [Klebsiella phage vB_KleM_RaK2]YP_010843020.1 secreted protein [Klebsiella phage K64-1]AFA44378.1 hypothetical protein RaK2_00105 [Klebsiella phage vB_KleM_RaK2]UYL05541.1 hypothetical protein DIDNDMLP_00556 [Klebsiella phage KP13-7]BEH88506.1 hypothetical protein [Klebsiella phage phiKp_21]